MDSLSSTHLPPCLELNDETQIQVFKSTQTKSAIFWRFRYLCTIAHAMMNQGKYFQRILMHNVIPRWKLAHFEIWFCYKTLCLPTSPHFQWHFLKVCNLNKVNRNYLDIFRKHMESSLSDAFLTGMVGMRWFWFSLQQHLFVWSLTRFCIAWEIKNPGDKRIILTI